MKHVLRCGIGRGNERRMWMQKATVAFAVMLVLMLSWNAAYGAPHVSAWSLPVGKAAAHDARDGWRASKAGVSPGGGAAIENMHLVVVAQPGEAGPVLYGKGAAGPVSVEMVVVATMGGTREKSKRSQSRKPALMKLSFGFQMERWRYWCRSAPERFP